MKTSDTKPSQSRFVAMNGRAYAWDATMGLDPSVALEVEGFIKKKAWGYARRAPLAGLDFDDLVQEGEHRFVERPDLEHRQAWTPTDRAIRFIGDESNYGWD